MEAILKFTLPEDELEFETAINAVKWYSVAWELDQYLRSQLKYNEKITEEQYNTYEEIREKLWDILRDKDLSFD